MGKIPDVAQRKYLAGRGEVADVGENGIEMRSWHVMGRFPWEGGALMHENVIGVGFFYIGTILHNRITLVWSPGP